MVPYMDGLFRLAYIFGGIVVQMFVLTILFFLLAHASDGPLALLTN